MTPIVLSKLTPELLNQIFEKNQNGYLVNRLVVKEDGLFFIKNELSDFPLFRWISKVKLWMTIPESHLHHVRDQIVKMYVREKKNVNLHREIFIDLFDACMIQKHNRNSFFSVIPECRPFLPFFYKESIAKDYSIAKVNVKNYLPNACYSLKYIELTEEYKKTNESIKVLDELIAVSFESIIKKQYLQKLPEQTKLNEFIDVVKYDTIKKELRSKIEEFNEKYKIAEIYLKHKIFVEKCVGRFVDSFNKQITGKKHNDNGVEILKEINDIIDKIEQESKTDARLNVFKEIYFRLKEFLIVYIYSSYFYFTEEDLESEFFEKKLFEKIIEIEPKLEKNKFKESDKDVYSPLKIKVYCTIKIIRMLELHKETILLNEKIICFFQKIVDVYRASITDIFDAHVIEMDQKIKKVNFNPEKLTLERYNATRDDGVRYASNDQEYKVYKKTRAGRFGLFDEVKKYTESLKDSEEKTKLSKIIFKHQSYIRIVFLQDDLNLFYKEVKLDRLVHIIMIILDATKNEMFEGFLIKNKNHIFRLVNKLFEAEYYYIIKKVGINMPKEDLVKCAKLVSAVLTWDEICEGLQKKKIIDQNPTHVKGLILDKLGPFACIWYLTRSKEERISEDYKDAPFISAEQFLEKPEMLIADYKLLERYGEEMNNWHLLEEWQNRVRQECQKIIEDREFVAHIHFKWLYKYLNPASVNPFQMANRSERQWSIWNNYLAPYLQKWKILIEFTEIIEKNQRWMSKASLDFLLEKISVVENKLIDFNFNFVSYISAFLTSDKEKMEQIIEDLNEFEIILKGLIKRGRVKSIAILTKINRIATSLKNLLKAIQDHMSSTNKIKNEACNRAGKNNEAPPKSNPKFLEDKISRSERPTLKAWPHFTNKRPSAAPNILAQVKIKEEVPKPRENEKSGWPILQLGHNFRTAIQGIQKGLTSHLPILFLTSANPNEEQAASNINKEAPKTPEQIRAKVMKELIQNEATSARLTPIILLEDK